MSLQANEFDVQSTLHRQVSLAAVNHSYVFHEAMNGCKKKSKDSLKACFESVNEVWKNDIHLLYLHFYNEYVI